MKAVVDTNVVAYLLLGTEPYATESRPFFALLEEGQAPAVWEAELANVLWMAARRDVLTIDEASQRLVWADSLGIRSAPNRTLWQGALRRAHRSGIAVYDTLFVELAIRTKLPLATFDGGLLKAFPTVSFRPAQLTSS